MNAPARISVPEEAAEDDLTPEARAYRMTIFIHCPNESPSAMNCRVHIAMLRDHAGKAMRRCSDDAYPLLAEIQRQAAATVYAPISTGRLFRKWIALESMLGSARLLEIAAK
jgi:hypothetical protein